MHTVSHQHIAGRGFQEKQEIPQEKKLIGNPDFVQDSHLKRECLVYFPQAFLQCVLTNQERYIIKGQFTLNRLDFGLGEESLILSDDVVVMLN